MKNNMKNIKHRNGDTIVRHDGSIIHLNHPRPVTRRDMLRTGMMAGAGWLTMPTWAKLGQTSAFAADNCDNGAGEGYVPYLVFDLEGGPGLPGNFLVTRDEKSQDLLRSYSLLGWDPRAGQNPIDRTFGAPMSALQSKLLAGIMQTTSATARANLRMGTFCHFSQDDSRINKTSPISLMSKLGFGGEYLRVGLGNRNTTSGGNTDVVTKSIKDKPLFVQNLNSIASALSFGPGLQGLSTQQRTMLAESALEVSNLQISDYSGRPGGDMLAELAKCAYTGIKGFAGTPKDLDPRQNALFKTIYGINEQTSVDDQRAIQAAIVMNVINQYTGPGVITVGGCDYHQTGQAFTDGKDLEIGQSIGRAVEAAAQLGKPLFFQIVTDGGVAANPNTRFWTSDAGDKSMTVIGVYNPAGPLTMRKTQIGRYTDGQGADRSTLIGGDPAKVAYAVFANYLSVLGRRGEFTDLVGRVFASETEVDSLLIF